MVDFQPAMNKISIERKLRMCQTRGVKAEAVVKYCESLTTKEMAYHRLSRRVNKMEFFFNMHISFIEAL
jgi:hypothetical protein